MIVYEGCNRETWQVELVVGENRVRLTNLAAWYVVHNERPDRRRLRQGYVIKKEGGMK